MARFGEGLSDTRSDLFMDMVRLITWASSISPTFGYVIENTLSQFDQREKIQECCNLSLGLMTKAKVLQGCQPRLIPGVTFSCPRECKRV
jgi:hypothetical protein